MFWLFDSVSDSRQQLVKTLDISGVFLFVLYVAVHVGLRPCFANPRPQWRNE